MRHVPIAFGAATFRLTTRFLLAATILLTGGPGCVPEVTERVVVEVQRLETQSTANRPIQIKLDPTPGFRLDDGRPQRFGALQTDLEGRLLAIRQGSFDPADVPIHISADDAARYSHFAKLVDVCRQCGFVKFELAIGTRRFTWNFADESLGLVFPPLELRLRADDDGELAGLALNDRALTDFSSLQSELIGLIGDDHGPGSIQEAAELQLVCDDGLKFRHLAAAYLAASGYDSDTGGRVALVNTIWPVTGWRKHEFEEFEMVEEFEIEPVAVEPFASPTSESLDVDVAPSELDAPVDLRDVDLDEVDLNEVEPAPAAAASADPSHDGCDDEKPAAAAVEEAAPLELEPAVVAALKWLADHQSPSGSWNFDHRQACQGRCDGQGTAATATNAATAIVVLPFLAAGQTRQGGEHKEVIQKGIEFLFQNAKQTPHGVSFLEPQGNMYSHGLATMALCEAYRQTKDEKLKTVCQQALNFICYAQDPVGGGWRYMPRQPGDTSVGGWQIAALRAGQIADLEVPTKTLKGASRFLDSVQSENGSYGYTTPGAGGSTTAIGLLSRIHLGGKRDDEVWSRGVAALHARGPSADDMYFNFYATQTLAQRGDEPWTTWHTALRKSLLASQEDEGHAAGSWRLGRGQAADRGGRLFDTAMAALVLVIPHRQLGIFQVESSDEESGEE